MAERPQGPDPAAAAVLALLIAVMVAGKAVRDAFFLSEFAPRALPSMVLTTALAALVAVLVFSRAVSAYGPRRTLFGTLALGGASLIGIGLLAEASPKSMAVAMYFVISITAPLAVSGFWSLVTERFDVRAVRRASARLGAAGMLGGIGAGILTIVGATRLPAPVAVPALGIIQIVTAAIVPLVARGPSPTSHGHAVDLWQGGLTVIRDGYVRLIGALVLLSAMSAVLLDYAFKLTVTRHASGAGLLRWFSVFYTGASVLAFLVQITLARRTLQRLGPGGSAAVLPAGVVAGSALALFVPGAGTVLAARGIELVARNSIFRSGYELLFSVVPEAERRLTKAVVDVGADRLGDILGAACLAALVTFGAWSGPASLVAAIAGAMLAALIALRLRGSYVQQLESGLLRGESGDVGRLLSGDESVRIPVFRMPGTVSDRETAVMDVFSSGMDWIAETQVDAPRAHAADEGRVAVRTVGRGRATLEADTERLRTGSTGDFVEVLLRRNPVPPELLPAALPLLARNDVAPVLMESLGVPDRTRLPILVEFMRDATRDLAARRRVPRVVARSDLDAAVEALFEGLDDPRFEMRVQCGRALLKRRERTGAPVDPARAYAKVEREVAVDRHIWETQQSTARDDWGTDAALLDRVIRARASASLAHVFTLLALVLPREPLERALDGLSSGEPMRRGLALEYLESVLPRDVRDRLWPFLEREAMPRSAPPAPKPIEQILADHESMMISVEELKRIRDAAAREAESRPESAAEPAPGAEAPSEPPPRTDS